MLEGKRGFNLYKEKLKLSLLFICMLSKMYMTVYIFSITLWNKNKKFCHDDDYDDDKFDDYYDDDDDDDDYYFIVKRIHLKP